MHATSTAAGSAATEHFYDPFGARVDLHGHPLAAAPGDVNIGFNGLDHDDELGLINQRGRVYNPSLRRFLTPDPIIADILNGQTYNPYSYVRNDPINRIDPSGYCDSSPCAEGGWIGVDGGWRTDQVGLGAPYFSFSVGGEVEQEAAATISTPTTSRQAAPAPPVSIGINDQTATPVRSTTASGADAGPIQPVFAGRHYELEGVDWFVSHGDRIAGTIAAVSLLPLAAVTTGALLTGTAAVGFGSSALGWLSGLTMTWVGGRQVVFGVAEDDEGRVAEGVFIGLSGWGAVGEGVGSGPRAQPPAAPSSGRPTYVPTGPDGAPLLLPRTPNGQLAPSSMDPHTQIGWQNGSRGGYVQTLEFGPNGRPVKQVDWTNHGRPAQHTDPHVHDYLPNPTGGTPQRGPARPPLPGEL